MMSSTKTIVENRVEAKTFRSAASEPHIVFLTLIRISLLYIMYLAYLNADVIQGHVDDLWEWLRHQSWYRTVYFETLLVQVYSFPFIFPYRFMYATGIASKYRIEDKAGDYDLLSFKDLAIEVLVYGLPFYMLDTFHVKHYATIEDDVIAAKRRNWMQVTRALPEASPQIGEIVQQLLVAFVIFDALFFLQHYAFHKSTTLYRWIHYVHHDVKSVNVKTTNKLHTIERVLLVLSANAGLKIQGSHPLTRTFFVFVFVAALYDNHSGYDFPYSYEKILPRGLMGGSRVHYEHHVHGRNYQPFFTYLDALLEWRRKKTNESNQKSIKCGGGRFILSQLM